MTITIITVICALLSFHTPFKWVYLHPVRHGLFLKVYQTYYYYDIFAHKKVVSPIKQTDAEGVEIFLWIGSVVHSCSSLN